MLHMCNIRCRSGMATEGYYRIERWNWQGVGGALIGCAGARGAVALEAASSASAAFIAALAARFALRCVLTLTGFGGRRPVRVSRLSTATVRVETADVFAQRRLVHVQHFAPTPAIGPGRVGTHQQ